MTTDPQWYVGFEYDRRGEPRGAPTDAPSTQPRHAVLAGEHVAACGRLLAVVTARTWPEVLGAHCRKCGEAIATD